MALKNRSFKISLARNGSQAKKVENPGVNEQSGAADKVLVDSKTIRFGELCSFFSFHDFRLHWMTEICLVKIQYFS